MLCDQRKSQPLKERVCPAISSETDHAEFNVADYHVRGVMRETKTVVAQGGELLVLTINTGGGRTTRADKIMAESTSNQTEVW